MLNEDETISLLETMGEFSDIVQLCLNSLEPHHITVYLHKLAAAFHKFYTVQRVISEDAALTRVRLTLVRAVKTVLANGLSLIGVSAPEKM